MPPGKGKGKGHTHDNDEQPLGGEGGNVADSVVGSESRQAGAGTRGAEAGAQSQESGAGAGVVGAQARYGSAGAEVTSDISQAEAHIQEQVRKSANAGSFDQFWSGSLARLTVLGEKIQTDAQNFANKVLHDAQEHSQRIRTNAVSHDENIQSLNQSERERTVRVGDRTGVISLLGLVEGLKALNDAGFEIVCKK